MVTLHKKWSFQLRISSVNLTKSGVLRGFGYIYWRNRWWATSFFVQGFSFLRSLRMSKIQQPVTKYSKIGNTEYSLHKKLNFSLRITAVNVTKSLTENFSFCAVIVFYYYPWLSFIKKKKTIISIMNRVYLVVTWCTHDLKLSYTTSLYDNIQSIFQYALVTIFPLLWDAFFQNHGNPMIPLFDHTVYHQS